VALGSIRQDVQNTVFSDIGKKVLVFTGIHIPLNSSMEIHSTRGGGRVVDSVQKPGSGEGG